MSAPGKAAHRGGEAPRGTRRPTLESDSWTAEMRCEACALSPVAVDERPRPHSPRYGRSRCHHPRLPGCDGRQPTPACRPTEEPLRRGSRESPPEHAWGMTILFDPDVFPLPTPNMGPQAAELFPWEALVQQVRRVRGAPI